MLVTKPKIGFWVKKELANASTIYHSFLTLNAKRTLSF